MKKLFALCIGSLVGAALLASGTRPGDPQQALKRNLTTFNHLARTVAEHYVDTLPQDRMFEAAIGAMLYQIDPYTEYYTADESQAFRTMTTGKYGGIGSYIMQLPDSSTVFSGPYEGSPAARAGVRSGDRILRIDTVDVRRVGSDMVSKLLKGNPGTPVSIEVMRPWAGADSLLTFTIERRQLSLPSVPYWGVRDGGVGYIKLDSFMDTSGEEVRAALQAFKSEANVKGVVLDLRGNGGGSVESAVEILGNFLPKGTEVLRMKGRTPDSERVYKTLSRPLLPDIPLVVLIDGGSASASEIVAGALQDLDRAVLIGTRSFGKGLVQSTLPMPYDGMVKVTTAKYYIPSGRCIQALDYSRRRADGSVEVTPEAQRRNFLTRAGRTVQDGGGLGPDITVTWDTVTPLTIALVRDNWIFDFATRRMATHPEVATPDAFEVSDEMYEDFTSGLDEDKVKYEWQSEALLERLRQTALREGYATEQVQAALDSLSPLLKRNLKRDLIAGRSQISRYIGQELMRRAYYARGEAMYSLRGDTAMERARELFDDPAGMRRLLNWK